jgi:T-complex protein 1 subunit beta
MVMARAVEQAAQNTTGKKQLAVDAFAQALKQLPTILADNAGLDSSDLVTRLRQAVSQGKTRSGLDLMTPGGGIADMQELGVVESYKLKRAVVSSASEAAEVRFPCLLPWLFFFAWPWILDPVDAVSYIFCLPRAYVKTIHMLTR